MKTTIVDFLTYLKIPISKKYCESLISSHPDYPSLLSIADVLDQLGIEYIAGKMEKEKLPELSFPYLLQLGQNSGELIAIKNGKDLLRRKNEIERWDGIVLHVEPASAVTDPENNRRYRVDQFNHAIYLLSSVVAGILLIWPLYAHFLLVTLAMVVTSLMGTFTGYLLIAKELGIKFKAVEAFCSGGINSDCDKILTSDAATLIGTIKLSDVVLVYFAFQIVLFSGASFLDQLKPVVSSLGMLAFLAVPVALLSIAYQYFRARTWCRLCLIIDGILFIQAFVFIYLFNTDAIPVWNIKVLVVEGAIGILIAGSWLLFKNKTEEVNALEKLLSRTAVVKNNPEVFTHLLYRQRRVQVAPLDNEMFMGNKNAPVQIIMASNLYCRPCREQHEQVDQLLNLFPDLVNVSVRFVPAKDFASSPNSNQYLLHHWWKNIRAHESESARTQQLLNDWYALMDLEKFKNKFPLDISEDSVPVKKLEADQYEWIQNEAIHRTPTFIVNGHILPKGYEIGDLAPLIIALGNEWKNVRSSELNSALQSAY